MAEEKTLSDVVERLDKLVDVLGDIAKALKEAPRVQAAAPAAWPQAPPAAKVKPVKKVAPGAAQAAAAAAARAQLAGSTQAAESGGEGAPEAQPYTGPTAHWEGFEEIEQRQWPLPPPQEPFQAAIMCMFQAAKVDDQEESFEWLEQLMHPDAIMGPHSLDHLRAFTFRKLRRAHPRFLQTEDPKSFKIIRTVPREVPKDAAKVKVFLDQFRAGTSPAPVYLARDPAQGDAWRVTQISI